MFYYQKGDTMWILVIWLICLFLNVVESTISVYFVFSLKSFITQWKNVTHIKKLVMKNLDQKFRCLWVGLVGFGRLWLVLVCFWRLWLVLGSFGWFWVVAVGFRWSWLILDRFGYLRGWSLTRILSLIYPTSEIFLHFCHHKQVAENQKLNRSGLQFFFTINNYMFKCKI